MENDKQDTLATDGDRSSLLSYVGNALSLDFNQIPLPMVFYEPLSFTQKVYELVQYWDLLNKANQCTDPFCKLVYISAFCISTYSTTERPTKSFNSLLGETFEYNENGAKFVCEQISFNPPTCASYMESEHFILEQVMTVESSFKGNSLDVIPKGTTIVTLKSTGERHEFGNVKTIVHNLIVGKIWIDNVGEIVINAPNSKIRSHIAFKECGWFGKNYKDFEAYIHDEEDRRVFILYGKWPEKIHAKRLRVTDTGDHDFFKLNVPQVIWEHIYLPVTELPYSKWTFSQNTIRLIQLTPQLRKTLPKSDSRIRPDRLAHEKGNNSVAGSERSRLENIQKNKKKYREENNIIYHPNYFEKKEVDGFWSYNFLYDKEKEERLNWLNENENNNNNIPEVEFAVDEKSDFVNEE